MLVLCWLVLCWCYVGAIFVLYDTTVSKKFNYSRITCGIVMASARKGRTRKENIMELTLYHYYDMVVRPELMKEHPGKSRRQLTRMIEKLFCSLSLYNMIMVTKSRDRYVKHVRQKQAATEVSKTMADLSVSRNAE